MKKAVRRSIVVVTIAVISLCVGFIYSSIMDAIDKANYPREYSQWVEKYSSEYGIPEYIVYSVIKVESNYNASAVSGAGAIGLMQITPDTFEWLNFLLHEDYEPGMLYNPETNIRYGTYLLSYLFAEFGSWDEAFAAYNAGMSRVKGWLGNPEYTDDQGKLDNIPFKETREYLAKIERAVQVYLRLYYT
jgi:soluble lytic murein transglycosylase